MGLIDEAKEIASVGYKAKSWIDDLNPLRKILESEGVKVAANRQANMSNGAEKVQVTIYFWPDNVKK